MNYVEENGLGMEEFQKYLFLDHFSPSFLMVISRVKILVHLKNEFYLVGIFFRVLAICGWPSILLQTYDYEWRKLYIRSPNHEKKGNMYRENESDTVFRDDPFFI